MFVATVMPTSDGHTVVLVNPDEEMLLPVGVALPEAVTIYGRLEHKRGPRPMTHDVLDGVVAGLGARVLRVQIDDLVDGTFIGTVVLQGKGGTPFSIDARAADALAIALSAKAPIYVAKPVMDRAALSHDDLKPMPRPADGAGAGGGAPPPPVGEDEPAIRVFDL
jgi:bifunctional DNase/RNase